MLETTVYLAYHRELDKQTIMRAVALRGKHREQEAPAGRHVHKSKLLAVKAHALKVTISHSTLHSMLHDTLHSMLHSTLHSTRA